MATNNSQASSAAQKYIEKLYKTFTLKTSTYNSLNAQLMNTQTQQLNYQERYNDAKTLYGSLQKNLNDAHSATTNVRDVRDFFKTQQAATKTLVDRAESMCTQIYQAMALCVNDGIARVEAISTQMASDNTAAASAEDNDGVTTVPWTGLMLDPVSKAQAVGQTALKAGESAAAAAFKAYVSNASIYSRTSTYLTSFNSFLDDLNSLTTRLIQETSLAKKQLDLLDNQVSTINNRLAALQIQVTNAENEKVKAEKEYNAARQGASYAGGGQSGGSGTMAKAAS